MLTKTQSRIMQFFTTNVAKSFSIRQAARELKTSYPLVHRAITPLIRGKYLDLTENNLVRLNYRENGGVLAYAENLRKELFLSRPHAKPIKSFLREILEKFYHEYFIIILFGSAVESSKPGDYDVLFVFETNKTANERERAIDVIASNHGDKFHVQSIGTESVFEMASKRTQKNVLNELLNKHVLLYGAENFYRLLKHARQ